MALFWGWWNIKENKVENDQQEFISVIIAAHNELENLKRFLPSVLKQNYLNYEVIIVLDRSNDGSKDWLERQNNHRLKWLIIDEVPKGWAPKKWAISEGIKKARAEYLAFTDADCEVGEKWLVSINKAFLPNIEVVLGLGEYFEEKGFLNAFIQFETSYTAFQFVGFAKLGMPYMGLGRNLAYRKSFFNKHNGFEAFKESLSGDDDLLINAYADPVKIGLMISPSSKTFSLPKKIFTSWIRQKWRHVSASGYYSFLSKLILGIFHTSHLWFYLLTLMGLAWDGITKPLIFLYLGKTIFSWTLFMLLERKHKTGKLAYLYPLLDFLYFIYNLSIVPIGLIRKPTWI